jgi:tetratricopeptide (TPR) repeat protein
MKTGGRPLLLLSLTAVLTLVCGCRKHHTFEDNYSNGLKYMEKGRYEMAQSAFAQANLQSPDNLEAQYQLAMADLKLHDDVAAYPLLRNAEEHDHNSSVSLQIRLELAKLYLAGKEYDQAQKRLVWILERDPNNKAARGLLATSFAGLAHPEEATQEIDRLLAADPSNLQGRVLMAAIDLQARNGAAAEKVLLEGVRLTNRSTEALMSLASFYQLVGQVARSAEIYQELVKREPKNIVVRNRLGWLYARAGDKASAEKTFREIAELAPQDHKAVLSLATYYVNISDWQNAINELERLIKKDPDTGTRNMLADVYYFSGRRGEALKLTEQLIAENNQDTRARMRRGMLLMQTGQYEAAVGEFTHVLYYQSDMAAAHYFLGAASMATGNEQVALQHMERALQVSKGMVSARLWLIDYHFRRGDREAALALAREAPDSQKETPDLVVVRVVCNTDTALTLDQQSELQKALLAKPGLILDYADVGLAPFLKLYGGPVRDQLEAAVKSNPNFRPAQAVLTKMLEAQGKQDQALAEVEKRVAANPKSFSDLIVLAKLQIKTGRLPAARETLQKANLLHAGAPDVMLGMEEIDENTGNLDEALSYMQDLTQKYPKVSEAWGRLGALQDKRHSVSAAIAAYEKAVQIDPRNTVASNNLAWLLATTQGDMERALSLAKKAHIVDPSNPGLSDTLGWILFRMGNYPEALQALGDAAKRQPDDASIRYHLGMAQSKSGRDKEALASLQAAIKMNPRLPEVAEIRMELATLSRAASR